MRKTRMELRIEAEAENEKASENENSGWSFDVRKLDINIGRFLDLADCNPWLVSAIGNLTPYYIW